MKSYQETLAYIFNKLPMYQRVGDKALKKNLDNICALLNAIGNPNKSFKTIHIAGTNGKGSVTHIIASILQESGLQVGCYTSPHYIDFRERIKINGQFVTKEFVVNFVEKIKPEIERIKPSFFEISVAMAFAYFKYKKVDVAVIETGLGGRLDSTNVITPLLSVITNISYDHVQFLGNTLPLIAGEKAGIIKDKVPVLIGEYQDETAPVFVQKAAQTNSDLHYAKSILQLSDFNPSFSGSTFSVKLDNESYTYKTDLFGFYQAKNIQTALAAIQLLKKHFDISTLNQKNGLKNIRENTTFMGRNTVLGEAPKILADSAHNEEGIDNLLENLAAISFNDLHIVYGTVADKAIDAILDKLPKQASYYYCQAKIPRALAVEKLHKKAAEKHLNGVSYKSVEKAFEAAKEKAAPNDLILITGSVFVVAEVLALQ